MAHSSGDGELQLAVLIPSPPPGCRRRIVPRRQTMAQSCKLRCGHRTMPRSEKRWSAWALKCRLACLGAFRGQAPLQAWGLLSARRSST